MAGLPMVLAAAFWAGGVTAAVAMGALFGACGVLTFGGLVARLAGPRWAPLAALVLALALPEQFISRSTYSEPLAQILFLGGLCLVIDSLRADGTAARVIAAIGGLALGLTLLVRIDGASDILPLIPYCGLLLLGRRRQALPLIGGLVVGGIYGVVDGLVLTRPYLSSIKCRAGAPGAAGRRRGDRDADRGGAAVGPGPAEDAREVAAQRRRRGWRSSSWSAFALRPYVQTVRAKSNAFFESIIASYQRADHLPVAPDRLYYELSLHWVFWYIGVPAVILATLGAALLSRRCLQGRAPAWVLPLMVFAWAIVTTLYKPSITPDQPWASRRLVPAVLPGFILLAVWAAGWLNDWLRRAGTARVVHAGVMACCVAALVLPAAVTTFGLRVASGGPVGIRLAAKGLAVKRTYEGEIPAVNGMCAAIPRDASVVFIGGSQGGDAARLTQVVRGMCGVPAADIAFPQGQHRGAGRPRHQAGRPAAGAPGGRAIAARALRRPGQADHEPAQLPGRERAHRASAAYAAVRRHRLDDGACPVTAPVDRPGPAAAETVVASAPVSDPSPSDPYVSIILPCYNEQDHVTAEVARICAAMDSSGYGYEVLAFDDASTDETLDRLHEAAPRFPHLRIVHFHRNGGSGTVRRIGTQQARGEIVVWTDADMTYPNERIPELVQMLEKDSAVDQVVGARTSEQGTHKLLRVPAKWFIRKLAERLTNSQIPDLNSGLQGVPAPGRAALPAAAAARVLLRHHDHARLPVQPA